MTTTKQLNRPIFIWIISSFALIFGVLTLKSGFSVLYIDGQARVAAGHYVPFVLSFNFISGLFYILTAVGIWLMRPWSARLSILLVVSIVLVYALLGIHVLLGGEYETRTVYAMLLRSGTWLIIAFYTWQNFLKN